MLSERLDGRSSSGWSAPCAAAGFQSLDYCYYRVLLLLSLLLLLLSLLLLLLATTAIATGIALAVAGWSAPCAAAGSQSHRDRRVIMSEELVCL